MPGTQHRLTCKAHYVHRDSQLYWKLGRGTGILEVFCPRVAHGLAGRRDITDKCGTV